MNSMFRRFFGALAITSLGLSSSYTAAAGELQAGDPAPDFSVQASDGKTYRLADFKGKQALVMAWFPKAFTGGCTAECKSLRANSDALRKLDVAYFTASCDDVETNRKFAESLELDYPILSDPARQTAKAFGVVANDRGYPARWTFYIGKDGKILFVDKQVKTSSHGEDVVAKLKQLGIPEKK